MKNRRTSKTKKSPEYKKEELYYYPDWDNIGVQWRVNTINLNKEGKQTNKWNERSN